MPRSLNERMEKRALAHGSSTGQQPSRPTGQDSSPTPSPLKARLTEAAGAAIDATAKTVPPDRNAKMMFRALKRLTPLAVGELLKSPDAKLEEWSRSLAAVFLWVAGEEGEVQVHAGRIWHIERGAALVALEPSEERPGAPDRGDEIGEVNISRLLGSELYDDVRELGRSEDDPRHETTLQGAMADVGPDGQEGL
jgi:hypothetical protein